MLKDLIKLSNRLDFLGLHKEANVVDSCIKKMSGRGNYWDPKPDEDIFTPIGGTEGAEAAFLEERSDVEEHPPLKSNVDHFPDMRNKTYCRGCSNIVTKKEVDKSGICKDCRAGLIQDKLDLLQESLEKKYDDREYLDLSGKDISVIDNQIELLERKIETYYEALRELT